ncbi:hypothetical protein Gogos_000716 [Gossypium gossypioides]|uniref:DUF4283 domain-containing protein n=1 Tax=Gossypium gossypioides TaxID=34282 RepID=A0A7J9CTM9_GOSGO|nr:hypothetical protein [Gossypium gossypioides]
MRKWLFGRRHRWWKMIINCVVGRCLTDSVVHFSSLRNTMVDLWHPIGGIFISDLSEKRYLFQFFHDVDMNRVLAGTPWLFNNHLILMHKIQLRQSDYDRTIPTLGVQRFMRINVRLDVKLPLKRKKKIMVGNDRIRQKLFGWDISLHAAAKRRYVWVSRWLCESNDLIFRNLDKEGGDNGCNVRDEGDMWLGWRDNMENLYPNPNHIPLGPRIMTLSRDHNNNQLMSHRLKIRGVNVVGPMDLISNGEKDPLMTMDEKKMQQLVEESSEILNGGIGND